MIEIGDLAFQIHSKAGNEGRIVEVLAFLGEMPFYNGDYWCGGQGLCVLVRYQSIVNTDSGRKVSECPISISWLRKIPPLSREDSVETTKQNDMSIKV